MTESITLKLPEQLHQRLVNTAQATQRPLEEVVLHALTVGSPPDWSDVPEEYQLALASLDRLEDDALWRIAMSQKVAAELLRYDELLEMNREDTLTKAEQIELTHLKKESELFMLRKAQAASILQWRGHKVPAT